MAYNDFPHPDCPITRLQASGSYFYFANGEYLGLSNTRSDYGKIGPTVTMRIGPGNYRLIFEQVANQPFFGGVPRYANQTGSFDGDTVDGVATSTDGTTWTAQSTGGDPTPDHILHPDCSPGSPSTDWMRGETVAGTILLDNGTWKAWGHGGNNTGPRAIWYATSADGLTGWTFGNSGAAVLEKGTAGAWDDTHIADPQVFKLGASSYLMLYFSRDASGLGRMGRATSTDGISWTKDAGNPVLTVGGGGTWDAGTLASPGIVRDGRGHLHCWYPGDATIGETGDGLGYAWSEDDGVTWVKSPLNPVLSVSAAGLDVTEMGDVARLWRNESRLHIGWGSSTGTFRGRLEGWVPFDVFPPTFIAAGTGQWTATNGATFAPGLPTGWAVGDLLILVLHASNNDTFVSLTSSGWTKRSPSGVSENNTAAQHVEVWWKRAVSGETAPTCSLTTNTVTIVRGGMMCAVRHARAFGDPFLAESRLNNAASATVSTTNISPAETATLGIFAYAYEDDPTAASAPNGPTDERPWQPFAISTSSLGNDAAIGFAHRKFGPSGSYGTPSTVVSGGTFANSPNVGLLFSIAPLASLVPPRPPILPLLGL